MTITIKLLHERRNTNTRRKIDGRSGQLYHFQWQPEHRAYCFTTDKQEEIDDIFNAQGRVLGSYFAPVFHKEKPKPLSDDVTFRLVERDLVLPDLPIGADSESIALAVLAGYERGHAIGVRDTCAQMERARNSSGGNAERSTPNAERPSDEPTVAVLGGATEVATFEMTTAEAAPSVKEKPAKKAKADKAATPAK